MILYCSKIKQLYYFLTIGDDLPPEEIHRRDNKWMEETDGISIYMICIFMSSRHKGYLSLCCARDILLSIPSIQIQRLKLHQNFDLKVIVQVLC